MKGDKKKTISTVSQDKFYVASQYQLTWWKFKKHKLAILGGVMLFVLYIGAIFCEVFAPYGTLQRYPGYIYASPQRIHFFDEEGFHFRPFVCRMKLTVDPVTWQRVYHEDKTKKLPIRFFVSGTEYKFWDLWKADLHFFGVKEGTVFLLGTDFLGRDLLSRVIYGSRISLSIGLIGVLISFVMGSAIGGISGYFGGNVDNVIQRIIEFIRSIPTLPLWMALSAALPAHWPVVRVYFTLSLILSFLGWPGLARVIRGKVLALREEDFTMAAKIAGATNRRIITNHLLPSCMSYIVVRITLAVPIMILGETSLSFLGLGLRPPVVSWGVLLADAQDIHAVALCPWLLIPAIFVITTVLAFNFMGDGLRDAADPYSK